MEILAGSIAGKLAEYTVAPIGRQVGYLAHYKSNYQNLLTKVEDLRDARDEVQQKADEVESSGKRISTSVRKWKTRVDAIIPEAETFLNDGRHAQTACLHGFCPNLVLCYQLSKKSTKLVKEIVELGRKKEFSNFAFNVRPQEACLLSTEHYHALDSRNSTVMRVMDELINPNTEMILVWGIGGVGKTTLVEEILRQAKDVNIFDDVVMVRDVKENPDLEKIQKEIAMKLGLSIDENHTLAQRASILCDRIKDKRTLVVLDDVWEEIDLLAVGVPRLVTCKVVLTCRSRKELSLDRRTQIDIALDVLNEEEAWSLFEKMAGDVVKVSHRRSVAIEVAKKCEGLPVLIVTVARALKYRNRLQEWKDFLIRLTFFGYRELEEKAYLCLKWSYDHLEDEELKSLFLLCGIIVVKNHISLADLLKYGFGLGLIKNVDTIEEARDALNTLVDKLKDSCLLLDSDINMHVRMHDLVCNVATRIAVRDQLVLSTEYGGELKEWPDKVFLNRCRKMSLKSNNIPMLSEVSGECQELEMFYLYSKSVVPMEIPSNFFSEMEKLKVLGFTKVRMLSLPPSLHFLRNLQTLCLEECVLEEVALVGHLSNLEILSFARSNIKQLPEEIGQLIRLRWLDLSDCAELKVISPDVISRLERLEDLTMRNVFLKWEAERGGSNASLLELKDLPQLTALEIYIRDASILPSNLFSSQLVRYQIYIGDAWKNSWIPERTMVETTLNTLKLKLAPSNELDQGIKMLLKRSEDLSLDGTESVNSIVRQLHVEDFQQLIHLRLQNNVDFTCIINRKVVFPNLTTLSVSSCDHIRFLFLFSMATSLVELKHLEISACHSIEEIVSTREHGEENMDNMFNKLENLKLHDLPNLVRFCRASYIEFQALKNLEIVKCSNMGAFITCKEIEESDPEENHDLKSETVVQYCLFNEKVLFPNLTALSVSSCDHLRFLYSFSMTKSLMELKYLEISTCHSIEEIVSTGEYGEENMDNMFNKLEDLKLHDLPSLVRFCRASYIEFQALKILEIVKCSNMGAFITCKEIEESDPEENHDLKSETVVQYCLFNEKARFPGLERLKINQARKLEIIWHIELSGRDSFCRLRQVEVSECYNLINIFPPSEVIGGALFPNLEILEVEWCSGLKNLVSSSVCLGNITTLKVIGCEGLEYLMTYSVAKKFVQLATMEVRSCERIVVIVGSNIVGDDAAPNEITFTLLGQLKLSDLPSLRGFCSSRNCIVKFPSQCTLMVELCPIELKTSPDGFLLQAVIDIERSYNHLNDKELKPLFLLCGITMRGNSISFEDLLRYSMGLGFFGKDFKVEKARDVLHSRIKKLKDFWLLTDSSDNRYVRMLDRERDVAKQIALRDQHILSLVEDGDLHELKEWTDKYFLEKCTIMSFPSSNNIPRLPEVMHCPALKMFLLRGDLDDGSQKISPRFFEKMNNLQVLSLRCMTIPSLPPSFQSLKNLDSLCLDKCILGDVALIGELSNLEILSFSESNIKQLPREVGKLTHLRLLDLSDCSNLEVISPAVISSLGRLEELRMRNSFNKWEVEGERSNACLSELKHLSQLSALEVHIPNADILPANLFSHKLERFNIIIGDAYTWEKSMTETTLNTLKVKLTTASIEELDEGLKFLVKRSEDLSLYAEGMNNIVHSLDTQDFEHLKHLQLQSNIDFNHIINKKVVFPNLRTLRVHRCDRPSFLFSFSMPESLEELKHLEISTCEIMEESLSSPREHGQEIMDYMFYKREDLKLNELPNITRFCSGSIEKLDTEGWIKLGDYNAAMNRNTNEIEETHSEENFDITSELVTIQYFLFDLKDVFPKLTTLTVHECDRLSFLFTISMAKSLVELKHLEISTCEIIEEIVSSTSEYCQENMENMFPKLKDLKLNKLPNLTRFYSGSYVQLPSLEKLDIQGCTKLAAFISDNIAMSGKNTRIYKEIEEKDSEGNNSLNTVQYFLFDEKMGLPNLTSLVVHRCDGLRFLSSMARSVVQLKHLVISECQIMEVVLTEVYNEENKDNMFPKLEQLKLNDLPLLDRFCSGSYVEFASLEGLHLEKCPKLETFICNPLSNSIASSKEVEERNRDQNIETVAPYFLFDKKLGFPKLERLIISDLPKLKTIWHTQLAPDSFCRLRDVTLQQCNSLKTILPDSLIAGVFQQLEKLTVDECGVEEIIFQVGGPEKSMHDQFVFPNLTCLEFRSLFQLKRFYPSMPAFSWPLLKTLVLLDCQKVDIFAAEFAGLQKTYELRCLHTTAAKLLTPAKQSSILINEKSFPKLEDLTFGPRPMDIWYGRPTSAVCCEKAVFAWIGNEHTDGSLPHLRTLRLHGMETLMRLWETQPAGQDFPKLEILEVKCCGLNNVELSSVSLQNLTILEVTFCWRLQYLTTYSVARDLRQLKKLKVDECKSMKQILASEGIGEDDSNCEIVFSQLQHLELSDLISLECFCSSNCTVKVPTLETLEVKWCSIELKVSSGILEVDSNMHLDVQKSHSSKEAFNTESACSSEKTQKQSVTNSSEEAEHIEFNARELHDDSLIERLKEELRASKAHIRRLEEELRAEKAERRDHIALL